LVAEAIRTATLEASGTYAIALVHSGLPGHLFGARRGSPWCSVWARVRTFSPAMFRPSSPIARGRLSPGWRHRAGHSGELCHEKRRQGRPPNRQHGAMVAETSERGKYPHYMLKEIYEQPDRVAEILGRTLRPATARRSSKSPP